MPRLTKETSSIPCYKITETTKSSSEICSEGGYNQIELRDDDDYAYAGDIYIKNEETEDTTTYNFWLDFIEYVEMLNGYYDQCEDTR